MAEIVAIFAASHAPPLYRNWRALAPEQRSGFEQGYAELGRRFAEASIDVLVMIGADHFNNFFLDNMPGFCIGVGETHGAPPEPWLSDHADMTLAGDPALAHHLLRTLMDDGFDPGFSHKLDLDHAFFLPFHHAGIQARPPLVPLIVNAIEPPLPTLARCMRWGEALRRAIDDYPAPLRVGLFASGGLSHSVGEAEMGEIDEAFDRGFLDRLESGDLEHLATFTQAGLPRAGNGAQEVRYWLMAHAAAGGRGFRLIHYAAEPLAFTGCGIAYWDVAAGAGGGGSAA